MEFGTALSRLSPVARRQLGLFTRRQAQDAGVGNDALWRLRRAELIERCTPRVFRVTSSTPSWHQSVLAACLDGGPECVASHRTAAALHGLDGFVRGGVIDVLVPAGVWLRRANVVVHHTRALANEDRTSVGAIPATTVARTLIDLGAVTSADQVEEAFDAAERDAAGVRGAVERRYVTLRARGRNGIGAMSQIRARREEIERIPRSVLERRMQRLLARAGLPPAISRYKLRLRNGRVVELDFAMVDDRLDLEVDGHGSHATRKQRAADNERENAIEDTGWRVRRFTYEQVVRDPDQVATAIRSALASRRP